MQERQQIQEKIETLSQERGNVLGEISRATSLTEADGAAPEQPVETDAFVQCPMCTRELPLQQAAKHLPQCFRQIEAKMSLSG